AQLEQEAALQDAGGDAGVADGAEQDGVVLPEFGQVGVGEGLTGGVVAPGAEVELLGLQLHILRKDGGKDLETFGHDLLADAVTGDHCEIDAARHAGTLLLVPCTDTSRPGCGHPHGGRPGLSGRSSRRCPGGPGRAAGPRRRSSGRARRCGRCGGRGGGRSSRAWEIGSFGTRAETRGGSRDAGRGGEPGTAGGDLHEGPAHDRHSLDRARRSAPTKVRARRASVCTITWASYYLRRWTTSHPSDLGFSVQGRRSPVARGRTNGPGRGVTWPVRDRGGRQPMCGYV